MPTSKPRIDLPDVYHKLGQIDGKMDTLIATQNKVIYALIALSGATVGLKLMGTPPLLVISSFINGFVFLFAAILAGHRRRDIRGWQFILMFGLLGIVGNIHKVIDPGGVWFRTCIFIVANVSLVIFLWQSDSWGYGKRIDDGRR